MRGRRPLPVLGDRSIPLRISDDGTRAEHVAHEVGDEPWKLLPTGSSEESLLRLDNFDATWSLAKLLLQNVHRNPLGGEELQLCTIGGAHAYVVRARVPHGAFLYLVYTVETKQRLVYTLGFFTRDVPPATGTFDGTADPSADPGIIAREAEHFLSTLASRWH